ncbi:MAG: lipopolysaccharide transport periplasmic protein LptA [Pseudomonadota bacterium]
MRRLAPALLLCWPGLVHALDDDARQAISIEADQVELDEKRQISTYTGHVKMIQGSVHVQADHIVITGKANKVIEITARGQPAYFRQRPEGAQVDVEAQANEVVYHITHTTVSLRGAAQMSQGNNVFRGEHIHYDMTANVVRATNGGNERNRVQVTIDPATVNTRKPGAKP